MKTSFAIIASILAVAGNIPFLFGIFRGTVKPHTYTWFVWTLVSAIVFFGQVTKGAGIGAVPTLVAEIFTLIIFLLSFKYGYRKITRSDTIFLLIALAAIVPWVFTSDPTLSVIIAVGIDVVAFIPTLRKANLEPDTERPVLYAANFSRHVLALFSMETYNIATTFHSIAMICTNLAMAVLLVVRGDRRGRE